MIRVANMRFAGRSDLLLLWISVPRLSARVHYENLEGGTELFPHVYGPIDLEAVIAATPFRPGPDGKFGSESLVPQPI